MTEYPFHRGDEIDMGYDPTSAMESLIESGIAAGISRAMNHLYSGLGEIDWEFVIQSCNHLLGESTQNGEEVWSDRDRPLPFPSMR